MKILFLVLGIPLVMVVIIIIANCIPSFDERRKEISQTPSTSKAKKRLGPGLVIILLLLLIGGLVSWGVLRKNITSISKAYEYEYKLSAGQKIYTQVGVGPGETIEAWTNQPFTVVASQAQEDGSIETIEYIAPAGKSGWQGNKLTGVFTIKGISDGTLVKISRQ